MMGRIGLFFRSMFSEWGSGLSGPASVPLAVAALWVTGGVQRVLYGSLAGILLLVSAYRIWTRQHDRAEKAEAELVCVRQKYFEEQPRLGLEINSFEGKRVWMEHNNPVTILIKHLSGRVPTSVHFEPIQSRSARFILKFDSLPHIDSLQPKPMRFEIVEVGKPELSARDREITHQYEKDMLLLFVADSHECLGLIDYALVARFSDGAELREQTFHLRWDWGRHGFRRDTT